MVSNWLFRSLVCIVSLFSAGDTATGAEITLRMRGGSFEVSGQLRSYNLRTYVINEPTLGTLTLDASRYECVGAGCPTKPVVAPNVPRAPSEAVVTNWVGGSAIGSELMPRIIQAYAESIGATVTSQVGSDVRNIEFTLYSAEGRRLGQVNVQRQGVTAGFAAMVKRQADVVWSSRAISAEEEQMIAAGGGRPMRRPETEIAIGYDPLVIVVSRENPAVSLTLDTIALIFAGRIKDWGELGLPAGKIVVYAPSAEMDTWQNFESLVLAPRNLTLAPDAIRLQHATEWSDRVAADPNGIGISGLAFIRRAKALNLEMSCGIVLPPTPFGTKTDEYPLARRMYLYTSEQTNNPLSAALIEFVRTAKLTNILRDSKFVDLEPEFAQFREQRARIATALNAPGEDFDAGLMSQLIEETVKAQRSSLTFRFVRGSSSILDQRSNEDMARLAEVLADPSFNGKTLLLLGFSDAIGRFDTNLGIARKRTAIVKSALLKAIPALPRSMTIIERAYGELAPVACNDDEDGRALNRRVEIWVR